MDESEKKELLSVIDSGWFTEAKKTIEFEKMFAKFVGSKYACAVTSGTSGLIIALNALGIRNKDQVIVPDLTFVASPNSVYANGGKSVLVDISDKDSFVNDGSASDISFSIKRVLIVVNGFTIIPSSLLFNIILVKFKVFVRPVDITVPPVNCNLTYLTLSTNNEIAANSPYLSVASSLVCNI